MKYYFYPGCKFKKLDPAGSQCLQEYLFQRFHIQTLGCCSTDYSKPAKDDGIIFVCPTCAAILEESAQYQNCISIYEFLLQQEDFLYPDFQEEPMMIQDCWRTYDHIGMQKSIRQLVQKMNIRAFETAENFEKTKYCGITTKNEPSPRYQKLAPNRLAKNWPFQPEPSQKQAEDMKLHARQYQYQTVICYCTGCMEGVALGGKQPVHLLSLLLTRMKEIQNEPSHSF